MRFVFFSLCGAKWNIEFFLINGSLLAEMRDFSVLNDTFVTLNVRTRCSDFNIEI